MGKHFSFIHCADLHLGEPFGDIRPGSKGPWNEQIGKATFKAFEKVVDAAIENRTDAILISGDVYNSNHHSLAAQMAFARELYRAAENGIETFIIHGNHDSGEAWKADIPLPESVHIFPSDRVESIPLVREGETVARVYGISYRTRHTSENLSALFHKEEKDVFSIGMLHTDLGMSGSDYAPCTAEDLIQTGMDYWALGHIHARKTVSEKPYIVYPGNTQGLDLSETGEKGCYLVDVGAYGTVAMKFIETDVIRWMDMDVDISGLSNPEELLREITKQRQKLKEATQRPNIIRLILNGNGPLHAAVSTEEGKEYILQLLNDREQFRFLFAYFIKLVDRTKPLLDLEARKKLPDITGAYLRTFDDAVRGGEKISGEFREFLEKQPELVKYGMLRNYISDDMMESALEKARVAGAEMLSKEEEDENH